MDKTFEAYTPPNPEMYHELDKPALIRHCWLIDRCYKYDTEDMINEIDSLRKQLKDEISAHAKTKQNFEDYVEEFGDI